MTDTEKISDLETTTKALGQDLSSIRHDIHALRRELIGSSDGLSTGTLNDIRDKMDRHSNRILMLEKGSFTPRDRDRILNIITILAHWKSLLAVIIVLTPAVASIATIIITHLLK